MTTTHEDEAASSSKITPPPLSLEGAVPAFSMPALDGPSPASAAREADPQPKTSPSLSSSLGSGSTVMPPFFTSRHRNSTDVAPETSEAPTGLRQAMRQAWHMLPGFRKSSGHYGEMDESFDDGTSRGARRWRDTDAPVAHGAAETSLQRIDSSASHRSLASSNESAPSPPSRTSSLQRSLHAHPMSEIPEHQEVTSAPTGTPAAPGSEALSFSTPPVPPPPPPEPPMSEKRAMFLRARTKSIDHMHKFLNLKNFAKDKARKYKRDPPPPPPPPVTSAPMAASASESPTTPGSTPPSAHLPDPPVQPVTIETAPLAPAPRMTGKTPPMLSPTIAPMQPLAPSPSSASSRTSKPPSPSSPPSASPVAISCNVHRPEPTPGAEAAVNDSPAKPSSSYSVTSFETHTSLATALDSMDRSFHSPDKQLRRRSNSVPGTSMATPAQRIVSRDASDSSDDRMRVGALALVSDDEEGDYEQLPPPTHDVSMASSVHDLFVEHGWSSHAPQSEHDGAQELLDNLGLDTLEAPQSHGAAPHSLHLKPSVGRVEIFEPGTELPALPGEAFGVAHGDVPHEAAEQSESAPVPATVIPSPPAAPLSAPVLSDGSDAQLEHDARSRPLTRILEPLNIKALSEQETEATSPPWLLRYKPRSTETEPAPAPVPASSSRGSLDEAAGRRSEDDTSMRVPRPLRGSKSSSLLTAVASQAHRIKKNAREAWPPPAHDDASFGADDEERSSLPPAPPPPPPMTSPSSQPETPMSMYRTKRNKSQPTLRIADDREFLEALEQVRMQHKERIAHRERVRSSRKASMPNLRMPPSPHRPPLPMSRACSSGADDRSGRSRAWSLASRAERESVRLCHSPEPPDVSTSFLEMESVGSSSHSSVVVDEAPLGDKGEDEDSRDVDSSDDGDDHDQEEDDGDEGRASRAGSAMSDPIPNELGIGHTTGNEPSAPFTNDDDWKKEVKALFLIRELVQTERSYAAHLESLLIVVLKWAGRSSTRMQKNVLMPSQPLSTPQRTPSSTQAVPPHLVTLRNMLPKLISVSRVLVYSIEDSPTSEGVARAFLSIRPRLEEVHVSWHAVVGATLRVMRSTEASKSKSKGRLGRVPVAPATAEIMRKNMRPDLVHGSDASPESDRRDKSRSTADAAPKELSAVDVAIMPTQRIPRYVLLLRDLLSHTRPDSEAYQVLHQALESVQELGYRCDQASTHTQ
ncbi:hypothetical protein MARU1_002422 [Malassezia arunalokei]|uniref:DH domain-containing protein n=1 Tax=Malassezia arunalokei TaxID=1514897 RepID=A0AAJ5Z733_9BASI|nr:hypothetical protein MARU1_002422 [Malassezia arunalokei]